MIRFTLVFICYLLHFVFSEYPLDYLINNNNIYEFEGEIPTPRVHHTLSVSSEYVLIYGGYDNNGTIIDGSI